MHSIFNWSGGKDSALCLYRVLQEGHHRVEALLTTFSGSNGRVTMHGVRQELLEQQAASIGLPLLKVVLPADVGMESYNQLMADTWKPLQQQGVVSAIFGDIHLEDLRQYREQQLARVGLKAIFPLWNEPAKQVVRNFMAAGFKAVVVCVNERLLPSSFAGRMLNEEFLNDLPANVDPCGENGEFHTFVYDGPLFTEPIRFGLGERIRKSYGTPNNNDDSTHQKNGEHAFDTDFWFCDLIPA